MSIQNFCSVYPDRPSEFRCPICKRFFCAECGTEHEGRMICSFCLDDIRAAAAESPVRKGASAKVRAILRSVVSALVIIAQLAILVLVTWSVFAFLLNRLEKLPADFHNGTVWEEGVFQ